MTKPWKPANHFPCIPVCSFIPQTLQHEHVQNQSFFPNDIFHCSYFSGLQKTPIYPVFQARHLGLNLISCSPSPSAHSCLSICLNQVFLILPFLTHLFLSISNAFGWVTIFLGITGDCLKLVFLLPPLSLSNLSFMQQPEPFPPKIYTCHSFI